MRQRNIIPAVVLLAILMLVFPVAAIEETSSDVGLPDLMVSNPRYYSASHDSPVIGAPFGVAFDITNVGDVTFNGETIVWCSSDRYFSKTLPLNKNNIIENQGNLYIVPGQTITVSLANYRPWGKLDKLGEDYLNFGVRTDVPEEDKENNDGKFEFVVEPRHKHKYKGIMTRRR